MFTPLVTVAVPASAATPEAVVLLAVLAASLAVAPVVDAAGAASAPPVPVDIPLCVCVSRRRFSHSVAVGVLLESSNKKLW